MKMKIFILLVLGTLVISHYKNISAAKAAPALDEETQETTTIGEPRAEEPEEAKTEETEAKEAEPEQNKSDKKKKAATIKEAEEEEPEEATEEAPATEEKEGKVFSRDEIGAILLCILFCVALICGYLIVHVFFKKI